METRDAGGAAGSLSEWRALAPVAIAFNLLALPFTLFGLFGADSDVFLHLACGRHMLEQHALLDREVFSFTIPGRPWTNYDWGFELLLAGAERALGLAGVTVVRGVVMLATANLLLLVLHRRTRGAALPTLAFGLTGFALYSARALTVRPHLFSYLLLLALLVRLEAFRRSGRGFDPWPPLICALWANLHGVDYPIALAAVGIYALAAVVPTRGAGSEPSRGRPRLGRWAGLWLACALAFLLNPAGPRLLATVAEGADPEVQALTLEAASVPLTSLGYLVPDLDLWSQSVFNAAVLAALLALSGWAARRDVAALGCFGLGLALALHMVRFRPEFALLALPFVAEELARRRRESRRPLAWGAGFLLLAGYLGLSALVTLRAQARAGAFELVPDSAHDPVGAARFIASEGLGGRLQVDPSAAGYVVWALFPRVRVLAAMRSPEPFSARELWLAGALGTDADFAAADRRLGLDLLLLPRQAPLSRRLAAAEDPDWALAYADQRDVVFARAGAAGATRLTPEQLASLEAAAGGAPLPEPPPAGLRAAAERLAGAWPRNSLAQAARLALDLAQGAPERVVAEARRLAHEEPRVGVYRLYEGRALLRLGRGEEAVGALRAAADADPALTTAPAELAEALLRLGRAAEGTRVLEASAQQRGFRLSAQEHLLLARLRGAAGRAEGARDAAERALWQTPEAGPLRAEIEAELQRLGPTTPGAQP